mgnify:CR=1 FL=1
MIQEFDRNGDLNLNGKVNIADAQIAYDLACGVYSGRQNREEDPA